MVIAIVITMVSRYYRNIVKLKKNRRFSSPMKHDGKTICDGHRGSLIIAMVISAAHKTAPMTKIWALWSIIRTTSTAYDHLSAPDGKNRLSAYGVFHSIGPSRDLHRRWIFHDALSEHRENLMAMVSTPSPSWKSAMAIAPGSASLAEIISEN